MIQIIDRAKASITNWEVMNVWNGFTVRWQCFHKHLSLDQENMNLTWPPFYSQKESTNTKALAVCQVPQSAITRTWQPFMDCVLECNGASFFSHRLRNIPHYGLLGFFLLPVAVHRTEPSTGKRKKKRKTGFHASRWIIHWFIVLPASSLNRASQSLLVTCQTQSLRPWDHVCHRPWPKVHRKLPEAFQFTRSKKGFSRSNSDEETK